MTVNVSKPAINVREKLAELDKPTGIAGEAMLRAETPQEQFNLIGAGRRNLLINGNFQVSQRGDFTTASSSVNGAYFVDRWFTDVGTVAFNKEQTTDIDIDGTPAISKGVKLTATASGTSYMGVRQKIENPTQYVGRTITYSGYVRSNSPNARLTSFIADTAGTTNQVVSSNAHSGSGQWEKLSVTFTMTSNATSAWFVSAFISTSGVGNVSISSGDYIEVTMLQMEINKVATPFEHRSYGEELAACQRYAIRLGAHPDDPVNHYNLIGSGWWRNSVNDYSVQLQVPLPVYMRHDSYSVSIIGANEFYLQGGTQSGTAEFKTINQNGSSPSMVWLDMRPSTASGTAPCIPCAVGSKNGTTDSHRNALLLDAEL